MVDITPRVKAALDGVHPRVYYAYPQQWTTLPVISYRLEGSQEYARADNREYLSEITYQIDIWGDGPADNADLAAAVHGALSALGLQRQYAADIFETPTGLHHRTMRYGALIGRDGRIYEY